MRLPNVRLPHASVTKLAVLAAIGVTMAGGAFAAYSLTRNPAGTAAGAEAVIRPARVAEISYKTQG
ncbi:MAG: hypothetical protein Q8M69_05970, partial [Reyranella sp.]|nr:hypothetical protein [Reyranella sp.]